MFRKALIFILTLMLFLTWGLFVASIGVNRLMEREVAEIFDFERDQQCITLTFLNKSYTVDLGAIKGETLRNIENIKNLTNSWLHRVSLEAWDLYEKAWEFKERFKRNMEEKMLPTYERIF
ncbi:MAG: hypothetical protein GX088_00040 [Clostridia bacterium]|nr:hypothetical protein [Clostridia bacterium]